jgi:hypothetical protein
VGRPSTVPLTFRADGPGGRPYPGGSFCVQIEMKKIRKMRKMEKMKKMKKMEKKV